MFLSLRYFVTIEVEITNILYHYDIFTIYKKIKPQKSKMFLNLRSFVTFEIKITNILHHYNIFTIYKKMKTPKK